MINQPVSFLIAAINFFSVTGLLGKSELAADIAIAQGAAILVVVLFFVFIDNSLKVSFRQLYSGMVTFFLWGVLLSRLIKEKRQLRSSR